MDRLNVKARMPSVSGLFVCLGAFAYACTTVGAAVDTALEPIDPAILSGSIDARDQAEADRLLAEGRTALDAGDFRRAGDLALEVEASYPTARGSSRALWIHARASDAMGKPEDALSSARRFRTYLSVSDDRRASVAVLEGDALETLGRSVEALEAWLSAPSGSDDEVILGSDLGAGR